MYKPKKHRHVILADLVAQQLKPRQGRRIHPPIPPALQQAPLPPSLPLDPSAPTYTPVAQPRQSYASVLMASQQAHRHRSGLLYGRVVDNRHLALVGEYGKEGQPLNATTLSPAAAAPPPSPLAVAQPPPPPSMAPQISSSSPALPPAAPTSVQAHISHLVRAAAFRRDPDATAELLGLLRPSDISLMRLLAFRRERRERRRGQGGGASAGPTSTSATALAAAALAAKRKKGEKGGIGGEEEGALSHLLATADAGFKEHLVQEKEALRLAKIAVRRGETTTGPASAGGGGGGGGGVEVVPLRTLLGHLKRQKLVRHWVQVAAREASNGKGGGGRTQANAATPSRLPSSTITRLHAAVLKAGAGGKKIGSVGSAVAGVDTSAIIGGGAAEADATAAAAGTGIPVGSSKRKRLTKLKRGILQDRVAAWVAGVGGDVAATFHASRAIALGVAEAVSAAEIQTRAAVKAGALEVLRGKEKARILARIEAGKLPVPFAPAVTAPAVAAAAGGGGGSSSSSSSSKPPSGGVLKVQRDPEEYAAELAGRAKFSKKRTRLACASLIQRGLFLDPKEAGLRAKAQYMAQFERKPPTLALFSTGAGGGGGGGGSSDGIGGDGGGKVEEDYEEGGEEEVEKEEEEKEGKEEEGFPIAPAVITTQAEGDAPSASLTFPFPPPNPPTSTSTSTSTSTPADLLRVSHLLGAHPITLSASVRDIKRLIPTQAGGGSGAGRGGALVTATSAPASAPPPAPPLSAFQPLSPPSQFSCDQAPCPALDECIREMLSVALFFQERAAAETPLKARRRILIGLREVARSARTGTAKLLVVASNLVTPITAAGAGGVGASGVVLDEAVCAIIAAAQGATPPVPVVYALSRKKLGGALGHGVKASVVAFLSLDDLRTLPAQALGLAAEAREAWRRGERGKMGGEGGGQQQEEARGGEGGGGGRKGGEGGGRASTLLTRTSPLLTPPTFLSPALSADAEEWTPSSPS